VKRKSTKIANRRQEELDQRLDPSWQPCTSVPVLSGGPIRYEMSDRVTATKFGGLGLVVQLVEHLGLATAIDGRLHLLKQHRPYHESDHVLNLAYNIVVGGNCPEDLENRRNDVAYMNALGARRIPDPTTARDFLPRFHEGHVEILMDVMNEVRSQVWLRQPAEARKLALLDVDGTIATTTAECIEGADFHHDGRYGYGPLVVSLANSQEVLYVMNRSANRPSHEGAVKWLDKGISWTKESGFEAVRLRGDTDFSLTKNFDRWSEEGVQFVFGIDAHPSFVKKAKQLEESVWQPLKRRPKTLTKAPRLRRKNLKEEKVRERGYKNYRLVKEEIAEISYEPARAKARRSYRMVIVRKHLNIEKGQQELETEVRYFFYVTNVPEEELVAAEVVFESNARCHQENLIEQLKNGVQAMRMPSGHFVANWAYMVIAALAWNLKSWLGLVLPKSMGARALLRMEYRRFVEEVISVPTQILRTGRRLVYRLLNLSLWWRLLLEGSTWFRQQPRKRYLAA